MQIICCKNYDKEIFKHDLDSILETFEITDVNESFNNLTNIILSSLDSHAPLKKKKLGVNQASFMNIEISKAIMNRSRLKSKYLKTKNIYDRINFKKQRNACVKLKKESHRYAKNFSEASSDLKKNSKLFYAKIKQYMTNKGVLASDVIIFYEKDNLLTRIQKYQIFSLIIIPILSTILLGNHQTILMIHFDLQLTIITLWIRSLTLIKHIKSFVKSRKFMIRKKVSTLDR